MMCCMHMRCCMHSLFLTFQWWVPPEIWVNFTYTMFNAMWHNFSICTITAAASKATTNKQANKQTIKQPNNILRSINLTTTITTIPFFGCYVGKVRNTTKCWFTYKAASFISCIPFFVFFIHHPLPHWRCINVDGPLRQPWSTALGIWFARPPHFVSDATSSKKRKQLSMRLDGVTFRWSRLWYPIMK